MKCGPTHHFGCDCHEKQWRERLEKAERERDEARSAYEEETKSTMDMARKIVSLESERNEARRLFESSKAARKSLSDACDHLQRKLDDARETLSDVRRAIGAGKNEGIRLAAMRVKAERDEALEQAAQLREKYRVHHDEAERITAEIFEVRKQRDKLAEALQMWRAEGPGSNACFCDAQFAMHGAHPSHSDECKAAINALSYLKTSQMEVKSE